MIKINQDDGITPVKNQNQNWFQIGSIIFTTPLIMLGLSVGNMISAMSDFLTVAIGIITGTTILALISSGSGLIAKHTKLGIAYSSKFTFGRKGAYITGSIITLVFLGWYGVELEIFGNHFKEVISLVTNHALEPSFYLIILLMGITVIIPAMIGFHSLKKCAISLVFVLPTIILGFLIVSKNINFLPDLFKDNFTGESLGTIISIVIGTWAAGYVMWGDFLRFARTRRDVIIAPFFGGLLGFGSMLFVGVLLSRAAGEYDIAELMAGFGGIWVILAIVWLVASTWMINMYNLYTSSLSSVSIFERLPRWRQTIILGFIAIFFAMLGIVHNMVPWLLLLGVLMPPLLAVMAIDFFIFRRREYEYSNLANIPNFRWHSFISWGIGSIFGFLTHFKVFTLTSSSALDAIIGAIIVHFVIMLYKS